MTTLDVSKEAEPAAAPKGVGAENGLVSEGILARAGQLSGWILLVLLVAFAATVWGAPTDSHQGVIQKILYVHAPLAFAAYLGFLLTALAGGLYLWTRWLDFDHLASAAAEVGVVFCILVLVTGPIWAKGTWGKWWSWDPRLTVTLLLWFVYLAYLLLRSFSDGGERGARFASVYGLLGALLIPLNYYVIEIFESRSMHPENLERGSLGEGMGMPFLLGVLTALAAFGHLLFRRWDVAQLRSECSGEAESHGDVEF